MQLSKKEIAQKVSRNKAAFNFQYFLTLANLWMNQIDFLNTWPGHTWKYFLINLIEWK